MKEILKNKKITNTIFVIGVILWIFCLIMPEKLNNFYMSFLNRSTPLYIDIILSVMPCVGIAGMIFSIYQGRFLMMLASITFIFSFFISFFISVVVNGFV